MIEGVSGMEGYEVDAFTMADHQRYFFFQVCSILFCVMLSCLAAVLAHPSPVSVVFLAVGPVLRLSIARRRCQL